MRSVLVFVTTLACLVAVALGQKDCCVPVQFTADVILFDSKGEFANLGLIFDAVNNHTWTNYTGTWGEFYVWDMYDEQASYVFEPLSNQCYRSDLNGTLSELCLGKAGGKLFPIIPIQAFQGHLTGTITIGNTDAQVWTFDDTDDFKSNVIVSADKCLLISMETVSPTTWLYKNIEVFLNVQPTANGFPPLPPSCKAAKLGPKGLNKASKLGSFLALKRLIVK